MVTTSIQEPRYDKAYYRGINSNYFFWYSNFRYKFFWWRRLKILEGLASGGKLLDAGCAFGYFLKLLDGRFDAYGLDISEYAINRAQGLVSNPGKVRCWDIRNGIPFDEEFDVITAFDVMEHIADPLSAFSAFKKHLKKEGCLFLEFPISPTLINNDKGHCYRPLGEWVSLLQQAGFRFESVRGYYTIGFRVIMIPAKRGVNYCSIIARRMN